MIQSKTRRSDELRLENCNGDAGKVRRCVCVCVCVAVEDVEAEILTNRSAGTTLRRRTKTRHRALG